MNDENNNNFLLDYKPKRVIISDIFREKILRGEFRKGDKLLPDEKIAEKYNINKRTVAAGLNVLVKEGLLERAPRRGTIVVKDGFPGRNTGNAVATVMLSKGDVYSDIVRNIAKRFAKYGLFPILINNDVIFDEDSVISFLKNINKQYSRPYGFIIEGSLEFPFDFLKKHINRFHNIVFTMRYHHYEKIAKAKYALVDFAEAGRLVARHFIKRGYKKVAYLSLYEKSYAGPWSSIQVEIMRGVAEVCRENVVKFDEDIFWKLLHGVSLSETLKNLLSGSDRPDAIFAYSDSFIRNKILPFLKKEQQNIELVGFYNTHHAEECGFSSISIREEEIAEATVNLLTGKTKQKEILIKPHLILR